MGYFLAIPDVISILNLVFGFLAILMVIDNHLTYASLCILVAVVFDSVDGWVSRKLDRDDKFGFGKNIDSLADIVSFGVAPSILLYYMGLGISDWAGYLMAIIAVLTLIYQQCPTMCSRGCFLGVFLCFLHVDALKLSIQQP